MIDRLKGMRGEVRDKMSVRAIRLMGLGFFVATLALILFAGCGVTPSKPVAPPQTVPTASDSTGLTDLRGALAGAEYLGNGGCAPCHANEFKSHKISGHNLTMHAMDTDGIGDTAPPVGKITGTNYLVEKKMGNIFSSLKSFLSRQAK